MGYLDKELGMAQADVLMREADLTDAIADCDRAASRHNEAKAVLLRLQADSAAHFAAKARLDDEFREESVVKRPLTPDVP